MATNTVAVIRAKCFLLGDAGVGKSSLAQVFESDGLRFPKGYTMTLTPELTVKTLATDQESVEIVVVDCPGKDALRSSVPIEEGAPSWVVLVFDTTSAPSFAACQKWLEQVRAVRPHVHGILVGNKADLTTRRAVSLADAQGYAAREKLLGYFDISVKGVTGVLDVFKALAAAHVENFHATATALQGAS